MTKILGICGQLGSGKDTAATLLKNEHDFKHLAFAYHIKVFCGKVFDFTEEQLWGPSDKRNEVKKFVDESDNPLSWFEWEQRLWEFGPEFTKKVLPNHPFPYHTLYDWFCMYRKTFAHNVSARTALQSIGTEWGRTIDPEIWLKATLREALSYDRVVISDVRFLNEVEFIQKHGGKVIKIIRPDTDSLAANVGIAGHKSEAEQKSMPDDMFDGIIINDKSLEDFKNSVETQVGILFL